MEQQAQLAALAEEDYEQAAGHIHRFLAVDSSLVESTAPAPGLVASLATLHEAETRVRGVVTRRFHEAVKDEDLASIERFFKIFPLLGLHEEGLKHFTAYLCTKIAANSKKNLESMLHERNGRGKYLRGGFEQR